MALTKEQIDILADNYIVSLFQGMESEVINDIARRINKAERYTETAEIQARNLRDLGYNTQQIQTEALKKLNNDPGYKKMIALNTKEYKAEVKQIIEETEIQARINGEDMIAQAGDMAWNDDLQMWAAHNIDLKKPSTLSQMKKAFVDQTNGSLRNITQTTAFMGTQWGNTGVINAYQKAMDMTVLKVTSGVFSYQQAVTDTIKALSQGLATVDYASGRKYHVDTAARMTVRTAASQLAGKITEENIKKTGVDLVYVDAHPGARPSHADWQGQVYSYSGNSKKYRDFYNATDYGSITGLKGINCTHNFWPYWEGDPIPAFKEPAPVTIDNKSYTYYEAAQKQRGMERNIRATKRQLNAMQALNDPKMAQEIQNVENSLKKQIQDYNKFSHKAGIDPQSNRLRVYDSITAAKAAPKQVAKSLGYGQPVEYDPTKKFEINLPGYSKEVNESLSKAAKEVARRGGEDGMEHGVFVDLNTSKIYNYTTGDKNSVRPDYNNLNGKKENSLAFVHCHTLATSLSYPDVDIMVNNKEVGAVVAARLDGLISVVETNGKHTDDWISMRISEKYTKDLFNMNDIQINEFIKEKVIEEYANGPEKIFNS